MHAFPAVKRALTRSAIQNERVIVVTFGRARNKSRKRRNNMSGEKIGEGNGTRGMRRVLSTQPNFKVEVSFEETGKLLGVEGMNMGTYTAITKPDGSLEGVGEGVFATLEGEFVTWRGMGVGRFVE